jgi:hypothetical protein
MDRYYLPLIHDLYVFAYLPYPNVGVTANRSTTSCLMCSTALQALPDGFGYGWDQAKRTCYSWGWSPHLPGYAADGFDASALPASVVQRIELMARFPARPPTRWFQGAVQYLESFRTDRGTYRFRPAIYAKSQAATMCRLYMGAKTGARASA